MKHLAIFIILSISILISTGCSIVGLAIGANTESEEIYYKTVERNNPKFASTKVTEGDSITLFINNGDSISGVYTQDENYSITKYTTELINAFEDEIYFPKLQDTIWALDDEAIVNYSFLGFVFEYMLLENANGDTIAISLYEPFILLEDENRILSTEHGYKEYIKKVREKARYVSFNSYVLKMTNYADQKKEEISLRDIELVSIRRLCDIVTIPVPDIDKIIVPYRKDYALTGFLVGLGIDAVVFLIWKASDPFGGPMFDMDGSF